MVNTLKAIGKITNFCKSHEYQAGNNQLVQYYKADLAVQRLSDVFDYIPLVISDSVLGDFDPECPEYASVEGELRTRNYAGSDGRSHLSVYVNVAGITSMEEKPETGLNEVEFGGIVCKKPTLRETVSGRIISDLLIAHNACSKRGYRTKSYYVPALTWGSAARVVHERVNVGDEIVVKGRLQSRKYHCKNDPENVFHWAYEISVNGFQFAETNTDNEDEEVA